MSERVSHPERSVLIRYILGQLPLLEEEQLEDRLALAPDFFAVYQEIESELLRNYAVGTMLRAEADLFERNYWVTSNRRCQAAILKALTQTQIQDLLVKGNDTARVWRLRLEHAATMLLVVAAIGGSFALLRWRTNQINVGRGGLRAPSISVLLTPSTRATERETIVTIPPGKNRLRMELVLKAAYFENYEAVVRASDGSEVWREGGLRLTVNRLGANSVIIELPSESLRSDHYVVTVSGIGPKGRGEGVAEYLVEIDKR